MDRGSKQNTDRIHEIIGRDQLSLLFAPGVLLQIGIQRHREQAGGETEPDQGRRGVLVGRRGERDVAEKDAHGDGAQRDETEFNMIARKPAGGEAARPNADGQESAEQADVKFIEAKQLLAEKEHVDLHQRAEKPKIGDSHDGKPKRTIGAQPLQPAGYFPKRI